MFSPFFPESSTGFMSYIVQVISICFTWILKPEKLVFFFI